MHHRRIAFTLGALTALTALALAALIEDATNG